MVTRGISGDPFERVNAPQPHLETGPPVLDSAQLADGLREPICDLALLRNSKVAPGEVPAKDQHYGADCLNDSCPNLDLVVRLVLKQITFDCQAIFRFYCCEGCGYFRLASVCAYLIDGVIRNVANHVC